MERVKKIRVLLVEDVLIQQKVAQLTLENDGYEVDVADDGKKAMKLFNSKKYDLIFMDLGLPDIDGLTVTQKIRKTKKGHNIPIVALTAHGEEEYKKRSLEVGMNDFIVKPITSEIAKSLIKKFLK